MSHKMSETVLTGWVFGVGGFVSLDTGLTWFVFLYLMYIYGILIFEPVLAA